MIERIRNLKETLKERVAGIFREPLPLPKDPLLPPELTEKDLPAGVSVSDYYIARNDFFDRLLLRLRDSKATGEVLDEGGLNQMLQEWQEHTGIAIDPRDLYELAVIWTEPAKNPKGYENKELYPLCVLARDTLRRILSSSSTLQLCSLRKTQGKQGKRAQNK